MDKQFAKSILLLIALCLLVFSCQVRDRRKAPETNGNRLSNNTGTGFNPFPDGGNSRNTPTPAPVATQDNFPIQFNHCRGQFNIGGIGGYRYGSTAANSPMGPYNVCKNSNNEVLIQPQLSITNQRICVIPAMKNVLNGTEITTSLGSAQCSLFPQAGGFYRFSLNITRPGANPNLPINSVVIVRDEVIGFNTISNPAYAFYFQGVNPLLPASQAFITCMNAIDAYQAIPQGMTAAIALCEEFKQKAKFDDPTI